MEGEPTDYQLIARANAGESQAFEALYRRHRAWAHAVAVRFVGDPEEAYDVVQDVFTYWFQKFPGFTLTSTARGFLFPALRNTALTKRRRHQRVVSLEEVRDGGEALRVVWPEDSDFGRLVDALPTPQREVLILRFAMDLKLGEIGEFLGIPLGTVKSRLHNGLATLREKEKARGF